MKNIPDSEDSERAHQKSAQDHKTCQYNDQKNKSLTPPEICPALPKCDHVGVGGNEISVIQVFANVSDIDSPIIFQMT